MCFHELYPSKEVIQKYSIPEQLIIIHSSFRNFIYLPYESMHHIRSFLIQILRNLNSSVQTQDLDYSELLNHILSISKTIKEDVNSLSKFLIEEHQQTSLSNELKLLLNVLNSKIPAKIKETKEHYKILFLDSFTPCPLIPFFYQIFQNLALFSKNFITLIQKIMIFNDIDSISQKEFLLKANDSIQQFDSILESIFNFLLPEQISSSWINSIQQIKKELEQIH
jgi:hypothetical protein